MGFEVTLKDITMPAFNQTLSRVYREKTFDNPRQGYKLKRLIKKIEAEQKTFWDMYRELQEKYAKEIETEDGKKTKQIDPERQDEFTDKINELGETKVTIEWHGLNIGDLDGFKLSAHELDTLEPILDQASLDELQEVEPS